MKSFQVFEGKTDCSLCHVGISNPKQLLGRSQHARGWAQAQSAAEPNSNHFHTKSQRSVFKGEREKETEAAARERDAGRGERRALASGGRRERREGEGAARGPRSRRGREGGAGGRRAREPETRQRFMGREGSMAAPRRPAGRSGHVTRPGPRRPPSLADALTRPGGGPEVMITRAGGPQLSRPARSGGPAWGQGSSASRGRDLAFPRVTSRPALAPPPPARPGGPGTGGAVRGSPARGPLPARSRPFSAATARPPFPTPGLRAQDKIWPCEPGPRPHSALGPQHPPEQ